MPNRSTASRIAATLAYGAALLALRVDLTSPLSRYLWGEDGNVFLNQARTLGIAGIFTPHAGYIVAWSRLVAFTADALPLLQRPLLYALGWIAAYAFMVVMLEYGLHRLGMGIAARFAAIGLAVLQPHNGESLMNLTNAQWMLATGLALLVIARPNPFPLRPAVGVPLLVVLGLTGPYSLLLLPVVALQAVLRPRPLHEWWWAGVLAICGIVQGITAASSGHFRTIPAAAQQLPFPWNWLFPIGQVALFGANTIPTRAAAIVFWLTAAATLVLVIRRSEQVRSRGNDAILLIATAGVFLGAALIAFKANPAFVAPFGTGGRYTWTPFVLLFAAGLLLSERVRPAQWVAIAAGAFLCAAPFERKIPADMQFASFANYAHYRPVIIPIAPPRARFPNWFVDAVPQHALPIEPTLLRADALRFVNSAPQPANAGFDAAWQNDDPQFITIQPIDCHASMDVAVEIVLRRSSNGWMQLFWSTKDEFREDASQRRWYPEGDVTAQFAFPNPGAPLHVRIDPAEAPGEAQVRSMAVFCLTPPPAPLHGNVAGDAANP